MQSLLSFFPVCFPGFWIVLCLGVLFYLCLWIKAFRDEIYNWPHFSDALVSASGFRFPQITLYTLIGFLLFYGYGMAGKSHSPVECKSIGVFCWGLIAVFLFVNFWALSMIALAILCRIVIGLPLFKQSGPSLDQRLEQQAQRPMEDTMDRCPECGGTGYGPYASLDEYTAWAQTCMNCRGSGWVGKTRDTGSSEKDNGT